MSKFVIRAALGGCAVAALLFLLHRFSGHADELPVWQAAVWPTSILLGRLRAATGTPHPAELAMAAFAAMMNGAVYFGLAWLAWWASRQAGWIRQPPSAKDKFISAFLAIGLGFSLLVTLGEAAIHGVPRPGWEERFSLFLLAANLFALIVVASVSSAWILWWLRGLYERTVAKTSSASAGQPRR